jgi:hypothetical protein
MKLYLFNPEKEVLPFFEKVLNIDFKNIDIESIPFWFALAVPNSHCLEIQKSDLLSQAF